MKERVKSGLLAFLMLSSLVLTYQIWFNEKLWPTGYNFFAMPQNILSSWFPNLPLPNTNSGIFAQNNADGAFMPSRIIVNKNGERSVQSAQSEGYQPAMTVATSALQELFNSDTKRSPVAAGDEWYTVLKGNAIDIDYGREVPSSILKQLYAKSDSSALNDVVSVQNIVIAPDTLSDRVVFYVRDKRSGATFKYLVNYAKSNIAQIVDRYGKNAVDGTYTYAFELGFKSPKLEIDPLVLIPINSMHSHVVRPKTIVFDNSQRILPMFGYSANTLRKFSESAKSTVYVGTYSTLKMDSDGFLNYTAKQNNKGIFLNAAANPGIAQETAIVRQIVDLSTKLWQTASQPRPSQLTVSTSAAGGAPNRYTIYIDYVVDGVPITVSANQSIKADATSHAVEAQVVDGYLVSYKQYFRIYEVSSEQLQNASYINALNSLFEQNGDAQSVRVSSMRLHYWDDGASPAISASWVVQMGGDRVVNVGGASNN